MQYLIYIPALLYLVLLAINLSIFSATTEINFFWLTRFEIPVVIFISIFFILYIILLYFGFNFRSAYNGVQAKKLEKENYDYKTKLLNNQSDLIARIEETFSKKLDLLKADNAQKLELYKKENEKVVSNMQYDFDEIKKRLDKISK